MSKKHPPLNALRTFIFVAKTEHVTQAAKQLGVTHSAVSQHIKTLEEHLDLRLFDREKGKLRLNSLGKHYLSALLPAFDAIDQATEQLLQLSEEPYLTLQASDLLASHCLIPALSTLSLKHPHLHFHLSTSNTQASDFSTANIDAAIYYGTPGDWPSHDCMPLADDTLILVANPNNLSTQAKETIKPSYKDYRYVFISTQDMQNDWDVWLEKTHFPRPPKANFLSFSSALLGLNAAKSGKAIALTHTWCVKEDIANNSLQIVTKTRVNTDKKLYLVFRKEAPHKAALTILAQHLSDYFSS